MSSIEKLKCCRFAMLLLLLLWCISSSSVVNCAFEKTKCFECASICWTLEAGHGDSEDAELVKNVTKLNKNTCVDHKCHKFPFSQTKPNAPSSCSHSNEFCFTAIARLNFEVTPPKSTDDAAAGDNAKKPSRTLIGHYGFRGCSRKCPAALCNLNRLDECVGLDNTMRKVLTQHIQRGKAQIDQLFSAVFGKHYHERVRMRTKAGQLHCCNNQLQLDAVQSEDGQSSAPAACNTHTEANMNLLDEEVASQQKPQDADDDEKSAAGKEEL